MKNFTLLLFAFIAANTLNNTLKAQTNGNLHLANKSQLKPDSINTFMSFSPVSVEGKVYVRWMVKNDRKDGLFIVERSEDGYNFEALGFKDRLGSAMDVNLFYSYVDEDPIRGYGHYRILQVGEDLTYRYSDIVKVKTDTNKPGMAPSAADKK